MKAARKLLKGDRTRQTILERAVDLASLEGLEGLSIGRLATDLDISKSGLFAHFGSKEELQLATLEAAARRFVDAVMRPALAEPRGMPRLAAICRSWMAYAEGRVFPGGCFFAAASHEFDGRPGLVHDAIQSTLHVWLEALRIAIDKAKEEGHLIRDVHSAQLAFEINALFVAANWGYQLHGDPRSLDYASSALERRLNEVRTRRSPRADLSDASDPTARPHSSRSRRAGRQA